MQILKLLNVNR